MKPAIIYTSVEERMDEFEKLLEESLTEEQKFKKGKTITGRVIKIDDKNIYVDIGYKIEGIIPREELPEAQEGQEVEAVIVRISPRLEYPRLSYRLIAEKKEFEKVREAFKEGKDLVGNVEKKVRGGYVVDLDGVRAFLPFEESGKKLSVGKPVRVKVLDIFISKDRPKIIVSHKAYVEEERKRRREELLSKLQKGDIVEAKVVKIDPNKGITLVIDGVLRVFLPREELSWGRDRNPYNYAEVDEVIKVKVKKINKEKAFGIVSLREMKENPWEKFLKEHKAGDIIEGKIHQVVSKGVVVDIDEGVEGFVPIEEVSWEKSQEEKETFKKGDKVKVKILRIEPRKRRVILSIREAQPKPWEDFLAKNPPGTKVRGKIVKIEGSRATVELEGDVKGVINRSDLSWTKPGRIEDVLEVGQELEFAVLGSEGRFVKLGIKQLTENPWELVKKNYKVGDTVKLPVKDTFAFGAFLEFPEGVDGLLPFSEVPRGMRIEKGEEHEVRIIDLNPDENKITLSIKALGGYTEEEEQDSEPVQEEAGTGFKLGDILKKKWKV